MPQPPSGSLYSLLLEPVFRAVETVPRDPAITDQEAQQALVEQSQAVMVAGAAFRHRQLLGYVDALVMVQGLVEGPKP